MQPEIVQQGPGERPICGMALEPVAPTLHEGPAPELVGMRRRLVVSDALSVPLGAMKNARATRVCGVEASRGARERVEKTR